MTYTTMSANLMLREVGLAMFLAGVGIGAGDGFVDAIANGGYRWVGYGVIITMVPILVVGLFARLKLKMNYYIRQRHGGQRHACGRVCDGISRGDVPASSHSAAVDTHGAVTGIEKRFREIGLSAVSPFFIRAIGAYRIAARVAFGVFADTHAADHGSDEPHKYGRADHVHYDVLPIHDIDFLLQI